MNTGTSYRGWVAAFLLAMVAAHAVVTWQNRALIARGYGDFSSLYTSGVMVRRGMGHQLFDLRAQWHVEQELFPDVKIRQGPMPVIRPPFEALLFVPFSYFGYPAAMALWSALKMVLLWLAFMTLASISSFRGLYHPWLEAVLCLGFFPVFLDFYQGQDAVLLLFLFVVGLYAMSRDRDDIAGLFLGLGLFKFHLVIPVVLVLVAVRGWRLLVGFVPTALALVAVSVAIAGTAVIRTYPSYLMGLNQAVGAGMVTSQSMPNLRGMLTPLIGRAPYPGPIHWLLLPVAGAALAYAAWFWWSIAPNDSSALSLGFGLAIVVAVLTSYYARTYDMTLLIVPLAWVGGELFTEPDGIARSTRVLIGACLLLICTPLYWALIVRWDCPYLLCIPMMLFAAGLVGRTRELAPVP